MEDELLIFKPAAMFTDLLSFKAEVISTCLLYLCSPFFSFLSLVSASVYQVERARYTAVQAVDSATRFPFRVAHGCRLILKKLGFGFLGAAYVCLILIVIMVLAALIGVGIVRSWVEEPVFVREPLHFDYTDVHPNALFSFGGAEVKKKKRGIPVGHTFYVSLELTMPESDFNMKIGIFQLTAEIISSTGNVLAKSSQPCMLRFRSLPVRLIRTFVMGIPLLLGISGETQKIVIQTVRHKERHPRTEMIRIRLVPRAGTSALPELYAAEILINSQLPWKKALVYNWKWTFYVGISFHVYIMLLLLCSCCCRQVFFMTTIPMDRRIQIDGAMEEEKDLKSRHGGEREVSDSESFRRWQRRRSKRKALLSHGVAFSETVGSSASSVTITRDDGEIDDSGGFADAESICAGS